LPLHDLSQGACLDPGDVTVIGAASAWESSPGYARYFCPDCGSRVFAMNRGEDGAVEYEISLGSYDDIGWFEPQYESWTQRREPWLQPLMTPQFVRDRSTPRAEDGI
jgi:hypothetical protein